MSAGASRFVPRRGAPTEDAFVRPAVRSPTSPAGGAPSAVPLPRRRSLQLLAVSASRAGAGLTMSIPSVRGKSAAISSGLHRPSFVIVRVGAG